MPPAQPPSPKFIMRIINHEDVYPVPVSRPVYLFLIDGNLPVDGMVERDEGFGP